MTQQDERFDISDYVDDGANSGNIELITDQQIRDIGYDFFINYKRYFVAVERMTFGKGRILVSDSLTDVHHAWCYEVFEHALIAALLWCPELEMEPCGWFRNPISGRRRPNGDPAKEYILH